MPHFRREKPFSCQTDRRDLNGAEGPLLSRHSGPNLSIQIGIHEPRSSDWDVWQWESKSEDWERPTQDNHRQLGVGEQEPRTVHIVALSTVATTVAELRKTRAVNKHRPVKPGDKPNAAIDLNEWGAWPEEAAILWLSDAAVHNKSYLKFIPRNPALAGSGCKASLK
jgi:hypothetical protein